MKLIFLDLETTNLLEQLEDERDIILQLAYIVVDTDTNEKTIYDVKCDPRTPINFGCMTAHHITPEQVVGLPAVKDTGEYKILKDLVESGEYIFFAHNAKFDIEVLRMVDIDIRSNCKVIDTLQIAELINDQLGLPIDSNSLGHLYYALGLYKHQDKINKEFGVTENMYHEAVTDILYLILYVRSVMNEHNLGINQMVELCEQPLVLTYVPFGKNRGERFDQLSYNQVKWYASLDNKNVSHTASLYL